MKLDKKDNVKLMKECCIVKEIESTQKRYEKLEEKFHELRKTIERSENLNFEDLHQNFDDSKPIKNFLTQMEKCSKFKITTNYYKKAVNCAKKHASENDLGKLTSKLKKQFLSENRIKNLGVRTKMARYIGVSVATLLASGTLLSISALNTNKAVENPIEIESTQNPTNPDVSPKALTPTKDQKSMDFTSLYLEKYNALHSENPITRDYFKANLEENQNYIYKVQIGDEARYVSHGDYPAMIEQYLKDNNIESETIYDYHSSSIYATDEKGDIQYSYDEFGNRTKTKLDSAISVNGKYVKLYDGNNPKDLLNPEVQSYSPLAEVQNTLHSKTQVTEHAEIEER